MSDIILQLMRRTVGARTKMHIFVVAKLFPSTVCLGTGQSYPQELMVFPHSDKAVIHRVAAQEQQSI